MVIIMIITLFQAAAAALMAAVSILCIVSSTTATGSSNSDHQYISVLKRGDSIPVEKYSDYVLISDNRTFSAGFYPVGVNAFCFAIWFTDDDKTVVWMANRDSPVNGKSSRLVFENSGFLNLIDVDGGGGVWTTNTTLMNPVEAVVLESGNLVMRDVTGIVVWQSFDYPTDTLLADQPLTKSNKLVARRGDGSYFSGFYSCFFNEDNVLIWFFDSPNISSIYWPNPEYDIWVNGRTRYSQRKRAVFDENGYFNSSDNLRFYSSDYGQKLMRRLTMDHDGILRLYTLNPSNKQWDISWLPSFNRSQVHGLCGPNAVLMQSPHTKYCACPPAYAMKDPSDWSQGCIPQFKPTCNQSEIDFLKVEGIDYWGYDLAFVLGTSLEACKNMCRDSCECMGFAYRRIGDGACYPKFLLVNGKSGEGIVVISFYMKVPKGINFVNSLDNQVDLNCSSNSSRLVVSDGRIPLIKKQSPEGEQPQWKYLIVFVIAVGVVEMLSILLGWIYLFKQKTRIANVDQGHYVMVTSFKRFTYGELKKMTGNFRDEIGRGGSGVVYKGTLDDERVVAVKKLADVNQGESGFRSEVNTIGRINHMNLVTMWGFCAEKDRRLLVYEYMENGSLDQNLFSVSTSPPLNWEQRFQIALGTAKGLSYLHDECLEWVLHCDIKPQNILLDKDFQPKVADFGLSKLLERRDETTSFSMVRGTRGYMAPEWITNRPITSKVDVYSYGVVALELVTGKIGSAYYRVPDGAEDEEPVQLIQWFREIAKKNGKIEDVVDSRLVGEFDKCQVETLVNIALKCVEEDRHARPTMRQVVDQLDPKDEELSKGI